MNSKALYNLTYGVYLLSAREDGRDNACIINTAVQVANNPTRISVSCIQGNLTHDMILRTGRFNLSAITKDAEFSLFQHFGLQSGRSVDKFADFPHVARSENGLYYLTKWCSAWLSLQVTEVLDLGSHTLFIAELTDADLVGSGECCTYSYYQTAIKQRAPRPAVKRGWRCKVCGYIHDGDTLPGAFCVRFASTALRISNTLTKPSFPLTSVPSADMSTKVPFRTALSVPSARFPAANSPRQCDAGKRPTRFYCSVAIRIPI